MRIRGLSRSRTIGASTRRLSGLIRWESDSQITQSETLQMYIQPSAATSHQFRLLCTNVTLQLTSKQTV